MSGTKGEDLSMFDTVKDHGERIIALEQRMEKVENNYVNLENTIWKTSQSTQDVFRDTIKNQFELIKAQSGFKNEENARRHELKKTKTEKFWEYAGKVTALLLSSGSILYVILEMASK
ncbi:hypothetical protein [Planomicrobium sp. MB-3u-38]|uniref:hypothetical protein n=1 Tax=Planomicrobium sp. MB-3u-38 TaxID=2058318 RepID=UPI000C7C082D|nr:hypothetical protein [Planomicrobium sp. MB-3u-38]PKH09872.1 hypothetical protein CXF70_11715 [Planomicrobium sp. MB-3u-38]